MRLAHLRGRMRTWPLVAHLVPMEAALSLALPRMRPAGSAVCLMVYGTTPIPPPGVGATLYPPLALITIDWRTVHADGPGGRVVEYVDLRWTRPVPGVDPHAAVGTHPHPELTRTYPEASQQASAHRELDGLIEARLDALGTGAQPGPEHEGRVAELLRILMEPGLEPWYRAVAPRFVAHHLGGSP